MGLSHPLPLMMSRSGAVASVGASFVVLGSFGLVSSGLGLLTERYLQRRGRRGSGRPNGRL